MSATKGHKLLANIEYDTPMVTMPMYGFKNVNARRTWANMVTNIDAKTHITLRPVLSTTSPNSGLATTDIK